MAEPAADHISVDPRWHDMLRFGYWACVAFPIGVALAIVAYLIWPYTPGFASLTEVLERLHADRLGGLMSLDLSVVLLLPIYVPQMLALYVVVREVNAPFALINMVFSLMGTVLWLAARPLLEMVYLSDLYATAATPAAQGQTLAAAEAVHARFNGTAWLISQVFINIPYTISAVLMLRGAAFRRVTAYIGLGLSVFGYGFWIPGIGPILSLVGTAGGVAWYILMAQGFRRLGWSLARAPAA